MRTNHSFWTIKHSTTLGFLLFIIFLLFLFLVLSFCCTCWPSTRLLLNSRISEKALTRREILSMDKQWVERGNFPLSFLLKLWSVLVHISSSIKPTMLVKVLLKRSRPAPQLEHKWSKVMTSQAEQMPRSLTGGLGHSRCQWINCLNFHSSII